MKIEAKFRDGLKHLMKSKPLDEINVVMLCDAVKSNRQTFYYHYRDISDVIESMFLKEKIETSSRIFGFESIIKPLIAYINANKTFLVAVGNSFASDKLESFFYSYFYQKASQYMKFVNKQESLSIANQNNVVRGAATILSKEMYFWIMNKNKETQVTLQKRLSNIWSYFTEKYPAVLRGIE